MMARYSLELFRMVDNPLTPLFDFDYDFYCDDVTVKKKFEEKFINHYYFYEIGCETHARWSYMLKARLNLIMPYYKQLYESELKAKDIEFLLNKDLREEFTRTLDAIHQSEGSSSSNGLSNDKSIIDTKTSNINDGVAEANLTQGYLTGIGNDSSSNTTSSQASTSNHNKESDTQNEKTVLVSRGNIGTTSSAELLERWRGVMINIDKMIIDGCRDLFMMVY